MTNLRIRQAAFLMVVCTAAQAEGPALTPSGEPRLDAYGDPLPTHALLRLGTTRFHHQSPFRPTARARWPA